MNQILKWFEDFRLIAVIRSSSADDAEEMIKAASAGGFRLFEISMQTPHALKLLEHHSKQPDFFFGAGLVTDGEMAQRAINAGARFLSTPYTDKDVINVAKNNEGFVIQGAFTLNEAVNATQLGADMVRIYPAYAAGGPPYLKSLRAALPSLKLAAAGGVDLATAPEYLKYCIAVFLNKALFARPLVRYDNWNQLTERARLFTQKVEASKVAK